MSKCSLPGCKNLAGQRIRISTSQDSEDFDFCDIHADGLIEAQEDYDNGI